LNDSRTAFPRDGRRLLQRASPALCDCVQGDASARPALRPACGFLRPWRTYSGSPPPPLPWFLIPTGAVPVEVVGVTDGDTITSMVAGRQIKVRLNGINAPEKSRLSGMPQNTRGRF
jgi:endonuclease YncB( thermonuclease family)